MTLIVRCACTRVFSVRLECGAQSESHLTVKEVRGYTSNSLLLLSSASFSPYQRLKPLCFVRSTPPSSPVLPLLSPRTSRNWLPPKHATYSFVFYLAPLLAFDTLYPRRKLPLQAPTWPQSPATHTTARPAHTSRACPVRPMKSETLNRTPSPRTPGPGTPARTPNSETASA